MEGVGQGAKGARRRHRAPQTELAQAVHEQLATSGVLGTHHVHVGLAVVERHLDPLGGHMATLRRCG